MSDDTVGNVSLVERSDGEQGQCSNLGVSLVTPILPGRVGLA